MDGGEFGIVFVGCFVYIGNWFDFGFVVVEDFFYGVWNFVYWGLCLGGIDGELK